MMAFDVIRAVRSVHRFEVKIADLTPDPFFRLEEVGDLLRTKPRISLTTEVSTGEKFAFPEADVSGKSDIPSHVVCRLPGKLAGQDAFPNLHSSCAHLIRGTPEVGQNFSVLLRPTSLPPSMVRVRRLQIGSLPRHASSASEPRTSALGRMDRCTIQQLRQFNSAGILLSNLSPAVVHDQITGEDQFVPRPGRIGHHVNQDNFESHRDGEPLSRVATTWPAIRSSSVW